MKKVLFLIILLSNFSFAREEIPILPLDRGVDIRYTDTSLDLINVDKMKKGQSVQKAKDELKEKSPNTIQIDNKFLIQQRALDYVTNPNKSFMPPIF